MTIVKTNSCKQFAAWLKRSPDAMMLKLTAPVLRTTVSEAALAGRAIHGRISR